MAIVIVGKCNKHIPKTTHWDSKRLWVYLVIMLFWMLVASSTDLIPIIIIPPITVVIFETLGMKMFNPKMAVKITIVLCLSITIAVLLKNYIENWGLLTAVLLAIMYLLLAIFKTKIPAVYAFPFLIFILPEEKVAYLPIARLIVSVFSFGLVLLYHYYYPKLSISKT